MAIQVGTYQQTDLRLTSFTNKRNFNTALTGGPFSGDVVGHWRAFFVRLPSGYNLLNQRIVMAGADLNGAGSFNNGNDWTTRIPGGSLGTPTNIRQRLQLMDATAWTSLEGNITTISQIAIGTVYLVVTGVANTGSNASPVWRNFAAICPVGGTPESEVGATATTTTFLANTNQRIFEILLPRLTTVASPAGTTMEEVAYCTGDFPWDTANNRPHHDALAALATNGGLTYETMLAAQNAGTLGYANLRTENGGNGKGRLEYRFTLRDLSAGLVNSGAIAGNLSEAGTPGGLTVVSQIAPTQYNPVVAPAITVPVVRFVGGRGTRPMVRTGTYGGTTTSLQRRVIYGTSPVNEGAVAGAVVPGFDWSTSGMTLNAGQFTCSVALPVGGPYTLEIRDTNDTGNTAIPLTDNIVGTMVNLWGQSGAALALRMGGNNEPWGPNNLNVAIAANALGYALRLTNIDANGSSTYQQPQPGAAVMRQGTTPAVGHGFALAVNEWNAHHPRHPLAIVVPAINGTAMSDWAANALVLGSASWRYLGSKVAPGVSAADGSGVVGYHALLQDSYTDLHLIMWTPGMDPSSTVRANWTAAIDGLFSNSPTAPWLVFPPWRQSRELPDQSSTFVKRNEHVSYVAELGARGALAPYWPDVIADGTGSLHSANAPSPGGVPSSGPISDANAVGQGRLGRGIGRSIAWYYDRRVKGEPLQIVGAAFTDGSRNVIRVQLPRQMRTLNGAALANRFSISLDNGVNFGLVGQAGNGDATAVTAALASDGRSVTLTRASGAWPATNVRVDYCRDWPFGPTEAVDEANTEALLYGLLYDSQTFRGNTNLATPAGNALASSNLVGAGVAGVAVAAAGGAAALVSTTRLTGARTVEVEMVDSGGNPLRTKTVTITAS